MPASPDWRKRAHDFLVDVFVMNSFSYAVAAPIELLVAGLSFAEHLQVRAVALVLNTLIGRPYGLWRDWVLGRSATGPASSAWRRYWVDTLIFLSFQLPLYVSNMLLGGAQLDGILKAAATATLLSGFLGRPYGLYLEWFKNLVARRFPLVAGA
ncbi:MAG: L-alanine exporter AlaE [Gammaproteobacteria bacterium]|nr:L-alanine exporter AlaE [Gammaproteobacteria bacterium]